MQEAKSDFCEYCQKTLHRFWYWNFHSKTCDLAKFITPNMLLLIQIYQKWKNTKADLLLNTNICKCNSFYWNHNWLIWFTILRDVFNFSKCLQHLTKRQPDGWTDTDRHRIIVSALTSASPRQKVQTYLEFNTPTISKMMSSNMVHEREKVIENTSRTTQWCTYNETNMVHEREKVIENTSRTTQWCTYNETNMVHEREKVIENITRTSEWVITLWRSCELFLHRDTYNETNIFCNSSSSSPLFILGLHILANG